MELYKKITKPTFDELTLFVLAYTCLLLISVNTYEMLNRCEINVNEGGRAALLPMAIIAVGIVLSFHHAFSKRKKTRIEKQIMYLFAAFVSAFAGIWGGSYLLSQTQKWSWPLIPDDQYYFKRLCIEQGTSP